jgi:hypothetical protein
MFISELYLYIIFSGSSNSNITNAHENLTEIIDEGMLVK